MTQIVADFEALPLNAKLLILRDDGVARESRDCRAESVEIGIKQPLQRGQ